MEATAKIAKQIVGRGFCARVSMWCEPGTVGGPAISLSLRDDPYYRSQGWLDAAALGAELGAKIAGFTGSCILIDLHGMVIDTSSTLVAIAAMKAVWSCVSYEPSAKLAEVVDGLIPRFKGVTVDRLEQELLEYSSSGSRHTPGGPG